MMLSSHNGISSAAFASLHFVERLAVGKLQCAELERSRESSSGDSDVQHGDSGGVSSVHNSSSLTTANLRQPGWGIGGNKNIYLKILPPPPFPNPDPTIPTFIRRFTTKIKSGY